MKKTYQKPAISRRQMGITSKFGTPQTSGFQDNIEGIPVSELTAAYGSPLFVYSYPRLKEIFQNAYRAFSKRYPKVHFAWSYKTNYLQAVCRS
ncbi:MAG: diaminopimelate decarboxylase, partial [Calditrichaeota bacterium]|nr:diaminopimelate decarboxylase [Calditrichota bacterium]